MKTSRSTASKKVGSPAFERFLHHLQEMRPWFWTEEEYRRQYPDGDYREYLEVHYFDVSELEKRIRYRLETGKKLNKTALRKALRLDGRTRRIRISESGDGQFEAFQPGPQAFRSDSEFLHQWLCDLETAMDRAIEELLIDKEIQTKGRDSTSPLDLPARPQAITLDATEVSMLHILANEGATMYQEDLAAAMPRGSKARTKKTIGRRLKKLRAAGLTHRSHGNRGGEAITDQGRAYLEILKK